MSTAHTEILERPDWLATQPSVAPAELDQTQLFEQVIECDRRLVQLLDMRLQTGLDADRQKDLLGMAVFAPQRETSVLNQVCEENPRQGGIVHNTDLISLYTRILRYTRTQQLQARQARGTITRHEQSILNKTTGTTVETYGLPT